MIRYLITGGGFANKGAESMLYTLIAELQSHSECMITVQVVHGFEFVKHNIKNVNFIPFNYKERKHILNPIAHLYNVAGVFLCKVFGIRRKNKLALYKAFRQSDVIIDISGYSLSSQWTKQAAKHIPYTIEIAKKFGKKVILLPQSFGPFDFPARYHLNKAYLKNILGYASAIFCREQDGFNHMQQLGLSNIIKSSDIVIQSSKPMTHSLTQEQNKKDIIIKPNSVLIVPNLRVFERTNKDKMLALYRETIKLLLSKNYNVYLTYYDLVDISICEDIKSMFIDTERVVFIKDNLNCVEFSNILTGFDFIISSRFHSIVHAYKHGIPAVVIGWAVKYKELLESVCQQAMLYDGRTEILPTDFLNTVSHVIENREEESKIIIKNIQEIQKHNCFDQMWEYI